MLKDTFPDIYYFVRELRRKKKEIIDAMNNSRIKIPRGKHTYGPDPILLGPKLVVEKLSQGSKIGCFCSIAPGLKYLFRGKHNTDWVSTFPFRVLWDCDVPLNSLPATAPIIIGNDVWIATNVSIMQGVKVGDRAIIAQESFVTKDVPPYSIVGGHPAKVIRFRFDSKQINELIKIAWWDWDDKEILKIVHLLTLANIDEFIKTAQSLAKNVVTQ